METIELEKLESVTGGATPRRAPRARPHAPPPGAMSKMKAIGGKVLGYGGAAMNVAGNLMFAMEIGQMGYQGYQWLTGKGGDDESAPKGSAPARPSSQPPLE